MIRAIENNGTQPGGRECWPGHCASVGTAWKGLKEKATVVHRLEWGGQERDAETQVKSSIPDR